MWSFVVELVETCSLGVRLFILFSIGLILALARIVNPCLLSQRMLLGPTWQVLPISLLTLKLPSNTGKALDLSAHHENIKKSRYRENFLPNYIYTIFAPFYKDKSRWFSSYRIIRNSFSPLIFLTDFYLPYG